MKYFEFGNENPKLAAMLRGGVRYRGILPLAEGMSKAYYHAALAACGVVNPDKPETEFRSPRDETAFQIRGAPAWPKNIQNRFR